MTDLLERRFWVFDLDGTLTRPVHDFAHIRRELGLAPDADILSTLGALPSPEKEYQFERLDELELFYAAKTEPATSVVELLDLLAARGCHMGILTRNSQPVAIRSLRAINALEFFNPEDVLGRDEARPKPDPEGIQTLLHRWQATPDQAVMVGDFRYDLEAGRTCGTATVHVDHGVHAGWPELTDLRVTCLSQLVEKL
ncbi:HAD family hydrolase [Marinobacterium lutimaris]|uniref:Haloacid dehalogenase superfamily, subfamily IA, variant 3 with third motif having DD or ED/haloacid dehalogenase superfamily, subfamily IA, variant 1 with third motif having Dx(3-4)D or Dx(3-4)E n=1 Tax=Marinobacterium lutimaris TaxID=568106 RepID=A0A1H5U890_9GAMM|nr:HAD family hydrolase [Marinobacterium lutimaris]SEF70487.1 haloacid dehalogenase superfamily, subfamily IA, variant 3 with third motif having DD or ED/haloacid dehalogenase superfamily, subfamily IA, variant 1 with third motif having Dx(3-4)D or Dx(3-4)E [Marinobacterium lutimaris]